MIWSFNPNSNVLHDVKFIIVVIVVATAAIVITVVIVDEIVIYDFDVAANLHVYKI